MLNNKKGFTLIELLVVIGIIAVLAGVVIVALNPARQFAQARNTQRESNTTTILDAIGQNMADNRGVFVCAAGALPAAAQTMADDNPVSATEYDIAPCIVPTYVSTMPFDPSAAGAHYTDNTDYNSGYTVFQDAVTGRITVAAPSAELGQVISKTR